MPGWSKSCHTHNSDAQMRVLEGAFGLKLHTSPHPHFITTGFFLPKYHPHAEIAGPEEYLVFMVRWTPIPDKDTMTIPLSQEQCEWSVYPPVQIPKITNKQDAKVTPPQIPSQYTATLLLHPFITTKTLFLKELTIAKISEANNTVLAFLKGCESGKSVSIKIDGDMAYEKVNDNSWEISSSKWSKPSDLWKPQSYVATTTKDIWTNDLSHMFWFHDDLPIMMTFRRENLKDTTSFLKHYSILMFIDFDHNEIQTEASFFHDIDFIDVSCGNVPSYNIPQLPSHYQSSQIKTDLVTSQVTPVIATYSWKEKDNGKFDKVQVNNYFDVESQKNNEREVIFGGQDHLESWVLNPRKDDWITLCSRNDRKSQRSPRWLSEYYTSRIVATVDHPIEGPVAIVTYEDRYTLKSYFGWYKMSDADYPVPLMEVLSEHWVLEYYQYDILPKENDPHYIYLEESLKKFCSNYESAGKTEPTTLPPAVDHSYQYQYDLEETTSKDPILDEIIKRLKGQISNNIYP